MIPLAELPTTDGVYVLHLSEPLAHARGYTGWAADIARRVAEHLDVEACRQAGFHVASHRGSPLVCAAIRAGRSVQVAQVYPGGDRGLERRLHNRHHPRVCGECRSHCPPRPRQCRLPFTLASPPLLVEGRALARCGGFATNVAERQARFRDKVRALAKEPERLPSGNYRDACADCGWIIIGASAADADSARCACPPTRYAYLVELVCSLCARPVTSIRVRTPHTRVVLFHPLRCGTCGGGAVQGEVTRVRLPEPIPPARVVAARPGGSRSRRHDAHPERSPTSTHAPRPTSDTARGARGRPASRRHLRGWQGAEHRGLDRRRA